MKPIHLRESVLNLHKSDQNKQLLKRLAEDKKKRLEKIRLNDERLQAKIAQQNKAKEDEILRKQESL